MKIKFGIDPTFLPSFLEGETTIVRGVNNPNVVVVECDKEEVTFEGSEGPRDRFSVLSVQRVMKIKLPPRKP